MHSLTSSVCDSALNQDVFLDVLWLTTILSKNVLYGKVQSLSGSACHGYLKIPQSPPKPSQLPLIITSSKPQVQHLCIIKVSHFVKYMCSYRPDAGMCKCVWSGRSTFALQGDYFIAWVYPARSCISAMPSYIAQANVVPWSISLPRGWELLPVLDEIC